MKIWETRQSGNASIPLSGGSTVSDPNSQPSHTLAPINVLRLEQLRRGLRIVVVVALSSSFATLRETPVAGKPVAAQLNHGDHRAVIRLQQTT